MRVHLLYGLLWLSFGIGHSLLATPTGRDFLKRHFGGGERLAYNIFAAFHIALVFAGGLWIFGATATNPVIDSKYAWLMTGVNLSGWVLMVIALRHYNLGRFSGMEQWRLAKQGLPFDDDEPLHTSGLHRYLRHPIYLAAFMILWGSAQNALGLDTAIWGSIYLLLGMRFEERKLERIFGQPYREYCEKVPAIIPWKGRAL